MRRAFPFLAVLALSGCLKPDHIELDPSNVTMLRRGDSMRLHAIFRDERGKQYPKEHGTWSSSDEKVVTVDNKAEPGTLTAVGPGRATVSVKSDDGLTAEAAVAVITVEKVTVQPTEVKLTTDGDRVPLVVTALDSSGRPLKDRKAHLKCLNEKICNSDGEGIWPSGDPGQTVVEVALDDKVINVPVTVEKGKAKK